MPEAANTITVGGDYVMPDTGVDNVFADSEIKALKVTIPSPIGNRGRILHVTNTGLGAFLTTVKTPVNKLFGPGLGNNTTELKIGKSQAYESLTLMSDGTDWHII